MERKRIQFTDNRIVFEFSFECDKLVAADIPISKNNGNFLSYDVINDERRVREAMDRCGLEVREFTGATVSGLTIVLDGKKKI